MKDWITRRALLKTAGGAAGAAVLGSSWIGQAFADSDALWKQFKGTRLNFISENTPPSSAISADHRAFTELTGIEINISQMELGALVQTDSQLSKTIEPTVGDFNPPSAGALPFVAV